MSLYGLTSCRLFCNTLDTKALLGWSRDTAVLAFRGTASLTNACSDLKVRTWPCHGKCVLTARACAANAASSGRVSLSCLEQQG